MFDRWQLVRSDPGQYSHPDELAGRWPEAFATAVPATVDHVAGLEDVDGFDWWYRCRFEVDEATSIHFGGLTFPAEIFLDGHHAADCASMFLPVRVDCDAGSHELCVRFGSLTEWLTTRRPRGRWRSSLVGAPGLRWARTTLIGRAPVYGNIPALVGFWRSMTAIPSRLHTTVSIVTDAATGGVSIAGQTGATEGTPVDVELRGPSGDVVATMAARAAGGRFAIAGRVTDPQSWWPRGYGPQPLYAATVRVDGQRVHHRTFGFRTLTASTEPGFGIHVNGVKIFCRGATWSPPDAQSLQVDRAVMRAHVAAFADAGANMLRIVGGLVYEQSDFWECCAELGVMVWQDAMQATFDPPDEVSQLITREMEQVLDEVSGNPALVVVSGGSETLQRPEMLGLRAADTTMDVIESLLPEAVSRHSDALYVRASPSQPAASNDLAIRPDTGIAHWFGVGGYLRPIADVRSAGVSFAAECLAFSNPPTPEAVERHFGSAAAAGHHPTWKAGVPRDRGASWDFEDVRDFYAREVFGEDLLAVRRIDPERYLQLGRLAIAQAMRECYDFWRRIDSGCSGALVLAGKDMCPGAGWGLLDVDGAPKLALHVLARAWAPVTVLLGNDGLSGVRLDIYNDTPVPLTGLLTLAATNSLGAHQPEIERTVTVPAHSALTYTDAELTGVFRDLAHAFRFGRPNADAIEAVVQFDDAVETVRDVLVVTPRTGQVRSGLRAVATECDGHWDLCIHSETTLRYVTLDIPGWAASDDAFHLAAGRPYTVRLTHPTVGAKLAGTISSIDLLATCPIATAS